MTGQYFAAGGGHAVKLVCGPLVQGVETALVAGQALLVVGAALRIDFNQGVGYVLGVGFHQHGVVPNMRVELAVMVVAVRMVVAVMIMVVIMVVAVMVMVVAIIVVFRF